METKYIKVDNHTIRFIEVQPQEIIPENVLPAVEYEYSFLLKQKDSIQNQWDEQLAQKNKEIEDINVLREAEKVRIDNLILEAKKLGIVDKVDAVPELATAVEVAPI